MSLTYAYPESVLRRFFDKVSADGPRIAHMESNCRLWTATPRPGHGLFWLDGRYEGAHRLAFAIANSISVESLGDEIIRHRCDVPKCCHPDHLLRGRTKDNIQDQIDRKRHAQFTGKLYRFPILTGTKHPRSKVSPETLVFIKANLLAGQSIKSLANQLNLSNDTIWRIATGRAYK